MIREFTQSAKNELYSQIDSVACDGFWKSVGDFFSDIGLNISYWVGALSINNYVDDVDSYHEKILDAKNTSKKEIDGIFQAVADVDTSYTGEFAELLTSLKKTVKYVEDLSDIVAFGKTVGLENSIGPLVEMEHDAEFVDMKLLCTMNELGLVEKLTDEQITRIQTYIESEVNDLGRNVIALSNEELKLRQELIVDLYRTLDLETADKFDELFNSGNVPLERFDCYNIMYLVYTSEEPYRSVFLNSLGTYTLGDVTLSSGCFYSPGGSSTNVNVKPHSVNLCPSTSLYTDLKGPYVTFFHECGHAIDDLAIDENAYCDSYMDGTNFDVISGDVYNYLEASISDYCNDNVTGTDEQKDKITQNVLNAIRNNGDTSGLSATERTVYKNIVKNMEAELNQTSSTYLSINSSGTTSNSLSHSGISDVYGGVTNNIIVGNRGHWGQDDKDKDGDGDTSEYTYWYSLTNPNQHTGAQESEMWAHYFSFGIVGHEDAMSAMEKYFPDTTDRYYQMANDMADCF